MVQRRRGQELLAGAEPEPLILAAMRGREHQAALPGVRLEGGDGRQDVRQRRRPCQMPCHDPRRPAQAGDVARRAGAARNQARADARHRIVEHRQAAVAGDQHSGKARRRVCLRRARRESGAEQEEKTAGNE